MTRFDVLTIGNAIVDIISRCEDDFLVANHITKGAMNLIDAERAELLYSRITGPAIETSGGSAGNTASGISSFGGTAAYFGKISDDQLGRIFTHDMKAQGVHFATRPLTGQPPTARSMIFVTPDGERSMNTYLGACVELGPEDIEADVVAASKIVYFEGYLWDPPRAKEAIRLAARIAHDNGGKVAISLSDSFCVDRYRDEFLDLMRSRTVDIVFANHAEALSLYQTSSFESALSALAEDCPLAAVTMSEEGSIVLSEGRQIKIEALEVDRVVDTTGAGDLYAAGFLYGLTNGFGLSDCGRLGSLAAGLVIQQIGPRVMGSLASEARQRGIIL